MSAPTPTVSFQGLGVVPADLLNTFPQVCVNYPQMRTFTGLSNMCVIALGASIPNDGGEGIYYWDAASSAPDNNSTIIVPNGSVTGAWVKITISGSGGSGIAIGTTTVTGGASGALLYDNGGVLGDTVPGTGVATALGVNVGTAGAFVVNGGALGTPSSGTLTSATGLPVSTGLAGLGTGAATALAINVGTAGAFVTNGGALGTPASGTLTFATGLPVATGVSGLGANVATALAVAIGSAGAPVLFNGAGGTPLSLTLTNATGLPVSTGLAGAGTNVLTAMGNATNGASGLAQLNGSGKVVQSTIVSAANSAKTVASPTAPASTSVYKMQGLAGSITPATTGNVFIMISGTVVAPTGTTVDNGIEYQISYGTGLAPANANAVTGTQVGPVQTYTSAIAPTAAADVAVPFSISYVVTGLTLGTAYWIDLAAQSITTASQMGLSAVAVVAVEI